MRHRRALRAAGIVGRAAFGAVVVVAALSIATFVLVHVAPGDAAVNVAVARAAGGATEDQVDRIRAEMGLDRPLVVQYWRWASAAVRGDFGVSARTQRPVRSELAARIGTTAVLAGTSGAVAVLVGVSSGVTAAMTTRRSVRAVLRLWALIGASIPSFWLSYLLIAVLAERLQLVPTSGRGGVRSWIMPMSVLALPAASVLSRIVATALHSSLREPFVTAARARGASSWSVLWRDAVPNASASIVSTAGLLVGAMFTSTFVAEVIFSWPGIGSYYVSAVSFRDLPAIEASVVLFTLAFVFISRLADGAHWLLDPRLRRDRTGEGRPASAVTVSAESP